MASNLFSVKKLGLSGEIAKKNAVAVLQFAPIANLRVQCESKKSPLRFSEIFSQTVGNF